MGETVQYYWKYDMESINITDSSDTIDTQQSPNIQITYQFKRSSYERDRLHLIYKAKSD